MRSFQLILSLLLVLVAKATARRVAIGYKSSDKAQATSYKNAGNTPNWICGYRKGEELGRGVYLSNKNGGWPMSGTNVRYCVITADEDDFNRACKVWFPRTRDFRDPTDPLFYKPWNQQSYIRMCGCEPERTIVFSNTLYSKEGVDQMLIPPEMLRQKNNDLKLESKCTTTNNRNELGDTPEFNFRTIRGMRGQVN